MPWFTLIVNHHRVPYISPAHLYMIVRLGLRNNPKKVIGLMFFLAQLEIGISK
jgi:hypothetical protein